MTERELGETLKRIEALLTTPPRQRAALWSNRKVVAAIVMVLTAIAGSIGGVKYVGTRSSTEDATANQLTISNDVLRGFVSAKEFQTAQTAQDAVLSQYMTDTTSRLNRVQTTADSTNGLVREIAGKLDTHMQMSRTAQIGP